MESILLLHSINDFGVCYFIPYLVFLCFLFLSPKAPITDKTFLIPTSLNQSFFFLSFFFCRILSFDNFKEPLSDHWDHLNISYTLLIPRGDNWYSSNIGKICTNASLSEPNILLLFYLFLLRLFLLLFLLSFLLRFFVVILYTVSLLFYFF